MKRGLQILWYILAHNCEEADRIRAIGQKADLRWWERWAERLHSAGCRSCYRARHQLDQLRAMARRAAAGPGDDCDHAVTLSAAARQRISAGLCADIDDAD